MECQGPHDNPDDQSAAIIEVFEALQIQSQDQRDKILYQGHHAQTLAYTKFSVTTSLSSSSEPITD